MSPLAYASTKIIDKDSTSKDLNDSIKQMDQIIKLFLHNKIKGK